MHPSIWDTATGVVTEVPGLVDPESRSQSTSPITPAAPGALTVTLPSNPALAPPGWYLVVVVDTDGIPSTGQWLHLNPDAPAPV
ncbi:galactose oxidase-like domain-containing protein [Nocardia sp. NPDC059229]